MKPTLMFDKNVFQGLGATAHAHVAKRFSIAIPRVLMHEIASNLEEGKTNTTRLPAREFVASLIRRFGGNYLFVTAWTDLCERELLGSTIAMNGVPETSIEVAGYTEAGKVMISTRTAARSISPYEHFARRVLAGGGEQVEPHRHEPFNAQHVLGTLLESFPGPWQKGSEADVVKGVDLFLRDPANTRALLRWTVDSFRLPHDHGARLSQRAQVRWGLRGRPAFSTYPYCLFLAKVPLLYFAGLHLWPRDKNDEKDLEYLRYLPFCNVLATNDKLMRRLGAHFVDARYQRIVGQADLMQEVSLA